MTDMAKRFKVPASVVAVSPVLNQVTEQVTTADVAVVKVPVRPITDADLTTLSTSQQAGVKSGDILASWDEVEVTDKASPTGKGGKRPYIRLEAQTAMGLNQLFDGFINPAKPKPEGDAADTRTDDDKRKGACDYANYGRDLEARAAARAVLMGELEGPEKAVKKMIVGLQGAEYGVDEIRSIVMNSPKFKGIDGLSKLIDTALKS